LWTNHTTASALMEEKPGSDRSAGVKEEPSEKRLHVRME
jgi:hypothetical protein